MFQHIHPPPYFAAVFAAFLGLSCFISMGLLTVLIIKWVFHGRTKAGNEDLWGYQVRGRRGEEGEK
jgi:hypothetical protein